MPYTSSDVKSKSGLNFLAEWTPPFSEAEQELLTRVGRLEATQLGVDMSFRYPNLRLPKRVWTSSAERTFKSARSLVRGLDKRLNVFLIVVVIGVDGRMAGEICCAGGGASLWSRW